MVLVVAAAAVPTAFTGIAVLGADVAAPRRMILFGVPVFAVLLGLAAQDVSMRFPITSRTALVVIIAPALLFQAVGAPVAPDYPNEPRYYLTAGEVEGKTFIMDHTSERVAMDFFYATEQVTFESSNGAVTGGNRSNSPETTPLNEELLNATLQNRDHPVVLIRQHADVMRFSRGGYRLTWDPVEELSDSRNQARVYTNGDTVGFRALNA